MKIIYKLAPVMNVPGYTTVERIGISPYQYSLCHALVLLNKDGPVCQLSCNIKSDGHTLGPMEFFIRTWSEYKGFYLAALERKIIVSMGRKHVYGGEEADVCRLDLQEVSVRFKCPACKKTFPTHVSTEWEEDRLIYCHTCIAALRDDDVEMDVSFKGADVDIKESSIRKK